MASTPGTTARFARIHRADWICATVLLGITLTIFWQGFFDRVGMIREDAAYLYQCQYQFAADEVRSGRFPHWNPFATCGLPFHASLLGAVLYPLRWPLFWLSWPVGYALSVWVHYFLTGLFMFIFLRTTLRCGPLPALIGAISTAFGGFTLGHLTQPTVFLAYPWFVLTVLLLSHAIERSSWVWAVAASLPVGLMGLAGAVHLLMILGFGLGLWALSEAVAGLVARTRSREASLRSAFRPAAAIGTALLLGGAIAMAQLSPALLQTKLSTRAEANWEFLTEFCAHPLRQALLFVAPFHWGNYRLGYWGPDAFHETCFYVGIVPLIFAAVAVVACPGDRWVPRLVGLCLITIVVAAGKYLPVYWLLYKTVPLFDRLRNPVRLLWWVQFALACLAAIGLQRMTLARRASVRKRAGITALMASATVVCVIAVCLIRLNSLANDPSPAETLARQFDHLNARQLAERAAAAQRMARWVMREWDAITWAGIAAAALSGVACIAVIAGRRPLGTLEGSLLAGILVFDLGMLSAGMFHHSKIDHPVLAVPPQAKYLQEHLGLRRYLCLRGNEAETSRHRGMLFRIRHVITNDVGINHTPRQKRFISLVWRGSIRMANLAGVRYLVTRGPLERRSLRPVFRTDRCVINENSQALPRAFLARQVRVFDDPNDMLAEIVRGKSDLSDIAMLEQPIDPLPATGPADRERGEVLDIRTEPGRFHMRTRAPGPRQLVLTETYHPQWRCRIDGEPAPVRLTDWTFMSVRVPAGEHEIEWWFEPTRFKWGLVVTAAALVFVTGTLMHSWFRSRRSARVSL